MRNITERKSVKISKRDIEKFSAYDKATYPQEMPCLVCGYMWMQHRGLLCPLSPGGLVPIETERGKFEMFAAMQIFGDSLFVPDLDYYKQNPSFEVV
jgi:hypothetical protein